MKYSSLFFLIFVVACKPDAPILEITGYKAGEITSQMTYHDFSPDIVLDTLPDTATFGGISNMLEIDLNKDNMNDLWLSSYCLYADFSSHLATNLAPLNSPNNYFSFYSGKMGISFSNPSENEYVSGGLIFKFKLAEEIPFKGEWTLVESKYKGIPLRNSWFALAGRTTTNDDMFKDYTNFNWRNTQNAYMGIRWIKNQDTLYGWVRMSVDGYSKIILHDCAFEKN